MASADKKSTGTKLPTLAAKAMTLELSPLKWMMAINDFIIYYYYLLDDQRRKTIPVLQNTVLSHYLTNTGQY